MKKTKLILIMLFILFFPVMYWAIEKNEEKKAADSKPGLAVKKEDELARVGILPFEDRTNSKNFQYMSESLSDAVNSSMIRDFSYNRIDPADVKKAIYEIRQEILKNKIESTDNSISKKQPNTEKKIEDVKKEVKARTQGGDKDKVDKKAEKKEKTAEQLRQDEEQLELVKKVARSLNSDIVIYGNYFYDNEANELVFTVSLYLALSDAVKELDETRNVVDNTIFNATDKVAKSLVAEIHIMIEEAEKIAAEKRGVKKEEKKEETEKKKPGEKTAITRKVAMTSTFDWSSKKFSMTLSPGFFMDTTNIGKCGACQLQFSAAGRLWVVPDLYLGLALNAGGVNSSGVPFFTGVPMWWSFDALAMVGYGIPVGRWLFSADLDMGYYLILDKSRGAIYYNPAFGSRVNAEYLISEIFSLGLSITGHMYYDKPKPLVFGGMALTVNFVF